MTSAPNSAIEITPDAATRPGVLRIFIARQILTMDESRLLSKESATKSSGSSTKYKPPYPEGSNPSIDSIPSRAEISMASQSKDKG